MKLSFFVFLAVLGCASGSLNFNFTVPYGGAMTLMINNEGSSSVSLTSFVFTTNAVIAGAPWGNLFPYSATMTSSSAGILTTYTIKYSSGVAIPASGSETMTYSFSVSGGPLGLAMGPTNVQVGIAGSLQNIAIAGMCQGSACNDPCNGKHCSGYYPSWGMYARHYDAINIPVSHINQIYYAFIGYHPEGALYLLDSNSDPKQIPVIAALMQQYPYLHASLSFGGWTLSGGFSQMANNTDSLNAFLSNVADALQETGFDGVDIDWEYPVVNGAPGEPTYNTTDDAAGYANLLVGLRQTMDALAESNKASGVGPTEYYLSIAGAGGVDKMAAVEYFDPESWPRIVKAVDVVNVMSYDFHGAFDQGQNPPYDVSDFMSAMETNPIDPFYNSPLERQYDVVSPIAKYQSLGFSNDQISVGIPAYGRLVMISEIGDTFGLYQTITGTPPGQYDATGVFDYRCIQERVCHGYTQLPSDIVFVNPNDNSLGNMSHTPWGYSASTSTFLTYDNAASASYKTCWAMSQKLFGYMIWDMSGDFEPSDPNSLVGASTAAVNGGCN